MRLMKDEENKSNLYKRTNNNKVFYPDSILDEESQLLKPIALSKGVSNRLSNGYDIMSNNFYTIDEFCLMPIIFREIFEFKTFEEYYNYLGDDIYVNSNFFQLDFSSCDIPSAVDVNKLIDTDSHYDNIDNYSIAVSRNELEQYNRAEEIKKQLKSKISELAECQDIALFPTTMNRLLTSKEIELVGLKFFIINYLSETSSNQSNIDIVMDFLSHHHRHDIETLKQLVIRYGGEVIVAKYDYDYNQKSTNSKNKLELKKFVKEYNSKNFLSVLNYVFDSEINYYIKQETLDKDLIKISYMSSIEEVLLETNNILDNVDATKDYELRINLDDIKNSENALLPLHLVEEYEYNIKKYYTNKKFHVEQIWSSKNGSILKHYNHIFNFFSEFCYFLNNDLSNSDLLECEGLLNLTDVSKLNFRNSKITSEVSEFLGIEFEKVNHIIEEGFEELLDNESTALMNMVQRNVVSELDANLDQNIINYISDIHLSQKLYQHNCTSEHDVDKVILVIARSLIKSVTYNNKSFVDKPVVIINGDTSSKYKDFEKFVLALRKFIDQSNNHIEVVFTLGNHELWDFPLTKLSDVYNKYRDLIESCGMYLLQNNLLYRERRTGNIKGISVSELQEITTLELRSRVEYASVVFFGGTGFSGLNQNFNADSGIYKKTITRKQEILESSNFRNLYDYVTSSLGDKNLVVVTHMPVESWTEKPLYKPNFVYITGHTHRAEFYDDLVCRVYADNQIGYNGNVVKLKHLLINGSYEVFNDYEEGIHQITIEQYNEYLHAKNLKGRAGETIYKLHMLKRDGYFCFISENKSGDLCILNSGAKKKLPTNNLTTLFDNMMKVIERIEAPLVNFLNYQNQIANTIKMIGGEGKIHGCIIDIDYYSHIYVDPFNSSITPYYALSMTDKKPYPTVKKLLEKRNKPLYENYKKLIADNSLPQVASKVVAIHNKEEFNSNTDMYRASKEILKMQKLNHNTLTIWLEPEMREPEISNAIRLLT